MALIPGQPRLWFWGTGLGGEFGSKIIANARSAARPPKDNQVRYEGTFPRGQLRAHYIVAQHREYYASYEPR
jgi:hypothetical protein